jgi:pyridoxine kinase
MLDKKVLTIQDISCFGQCSLTVALPVISAFGTECAILPTAVLSTHTAGFKGYTCRDLTNDIPSICQHWQKEKITFDIVYTGYLCGAEQIKLVSDYLPKVKKENGLFVVDPVMADNGNFYPGFDKEFALKMAELCSNADIIVPNITEACFLTDMPYIEGGYTKEYIEELLYKLAALGPKTVVLTGVSFDAQKLGIAVYDSSTEETFYYFNDKIPHSFHGTGDLYSSSLVGALSLGKDVYESSSIAVDTTVEAMKLSYDDRLTHWYGVKFEKATPYICERIKQ